MPITLTRTILVVLIPGGIALIPWILWILMGMDTSSGDSFYHSYSIPINLCFFAAVVIAGTILEGINTHIELQWDNQREEEFSVTENWYAYLCCALPNEPVVFRYITRMVTTMYFELGMTWASLSFGLGLSAITCERKPEFFQAYALLAIVLSLVFAGYFFWQAKTSHKVLCRVRKEFNERSKR